MKLQLVVGSVALAAVLVAVRLWASDTNGAWPSTAVMVGAGLGLIVVVGMMGVWRRHWQRRRLKDMRDSALW